MTCTRSWKRTDWSALVRLAWGVSSEAKADISSPSLSSSMENRTLSADEDADADDVDDEEGLVERSSRELARSGWLSTPSLIRPFWRPPRSGMC
jgi:hypothetical protein